MCVADFATSKWMCFKEWFHYKASWQWKYWTHSPKSAFTFSLSRKVLKYTWDKDSDAIFLFSIVFLSTLALNYCKEIYTLHEVLFPKPMLIQFLVVSLNVVFETSPGMFCWCLLKKVKSLFCHLLLCVIFNFNSGKAAKEIKLWEEIFQRYFRTLILFTPFSF